MPSTVSENKVKDKMDRKKKKKKLHTDKSHEDEIQPDPDTCDIKKTKRERSSSLHHADDHTEQPPEKQNFHSDELGQQSPLLADEQPVMLVKKKKKKKKVTSEGSKSSSIFEDDGDRENELESPVVLENEEKSKKRRKKCKEGDIDEEPNNNNNECPDEVRKTKKKKKGAKHDEEHLESVESSHSNPVEDEETSLSPSMTASFSNFKERLEKKKKKKHKKHRQISSYEQIPSEEQENNVVEGDGQCDIDTAVHKLKKKKKRKREVQESDNVCSVEEEQEENLNSETSKKKKKREKHHENSVDNDDTQSPHSHTTPKSTSNLFKDAVFESAERKRQFSRITGKSSKVDSDTCSGIKDITDSSPQANNNTEEQTSSPFVRGQWQGALFENKERQSKFLRLLGGMKSNKDDKKNLFSSQNSSLKKGLYGSLSASVPNLNTSSDRSNSSDSKGTKALCISDAAEIDKRLEEDYNKAMNFKLSGTKGAGLGFAPDPAEGKKFHIDAKSTKSIKFDDDDD